MPSTPYIRFEPSVTEPTILYKRTATNEVWYWCIQPDTVSGTSYQLEWGIQGTRSPQFQEVMCGSRQKMVSEVRSRIREQMDRKGYTLHVPDTVPQLPMLAQKWEDHYEKVLSGTREPFPRIAIQPKLDGLRCIADKDKIVSRRNEVITSLPNVQRVLKYLPPGMKLDGELYIHGVPLQTLQSYVRRQQPHQLHTSVEYHVFDLISDEPFHKRYEILNFIILSLQQQFDHYLRELSSLPSHIKTTDLIFPFPIKVVPTKFHNEESLHPTSILTIKNTFQHYRSLNYEGVMIRNTESDYDLNYRSPNLLKYKEYEDGEFEIVDVVEVANRCGLFVCKTPEGKIFEANPAWTNEAKRRLLKLKDKYIGKWLHVQYEKLSLNGIPLKPIGKLTHDSPHERH